MAKRTDTHIHKCIFKLCIDATIILKFSQTHLDIFLQEGEQCHYNSRHPLRSLSIACLQCRAYLMIIKRIINGRVIISGNGRQAVASAIVIIDADQRGLNFIM